MKLKPDGCASREPHAANRKLATTSIILRTVFGILFSQTAGAFCAIQKSLRTGVAARTVTLAGSCVVYLSPGESGVGTRGGTDLQDCVLVTAVVKERSGVYDEFFRGVRCHSLVTNI